ncbi:FtsW/RodA/SpoVE family cell cycle protein [uncultured Draconibacterium sp.]|uniref:FtsW/RodA/SpoVE family cell cycle protein n=1 Tax=uncultured Draconibacterium sp. TaxID=1573823 RepID=UPI0025E307F0|nr:FtsW/RodA/SpoVE family cell cycle protein [uncultured Draconibacterium sp.]
MQHSILKLFKGDRVLWMVLMLLSVLSLLIVYSSTGALAYRVASGNTLKYLFRQVGFLSAGIAVILVMVNVLPIKLYSKLAWWALLASIAFLLFSVLMRGTQFVSTSGRTLNFWGVTFQPAEMAKIALILFSAKILGKRQKTKGDLWEAFKKIIFYTGIVCGLIFISDFSTSALLFATIMTMMFCGRIPLKYLFSVVGAGIALVVVIYITAEMLPSGFGRVQTMKGRIERFIHGDPNSEKGITQADYAKLAIYTGGIFGKGPGHSDVSNYMAAAYNDFIFAIIVEEYGLLGGIAVIMLFLIFFFRGVVIVRRATRTFPAFLVIGLTLVLVFQAMINIGVSSGALPVTGQPLPWISLGGTSLLFTSLAFGLILSVSHQNQQDKEVTEQPIMIKAPDEDYEIENESAND